MINTKAGLTNLLITLKMIYIGIKLHYNTDEKSKQWSNSRPTCSGREETLEEGRNSVSLHPEHSGRLQLDLHFRETSTLRDVAQYILKKIYY